MAYCVDCGTILERAGSACPACGRGSPAARRACTQCGQAAGSEHRFCAKCGSRLAESEAPLEFDSAVEAKLRRLAGSSTRAAEPASAPPIGTRARNVPARAEAQVGSDWVPPWLNRLSYSRLVWSGLLGVALTVVADVLRTFSDRWLVESRELSSGIWVVRDEVTYSLGETCQNLAFFMRGLGVLLAFVATMLILLRAMRKTLVGKRES